MSNPTTLQELADSLAASADAARQRIKALNADMGVYGSLATRETGYVQALLDTRATVLAMIQDVNRRIANNNRTDDPGQQDIRDGRIEAYEDVRGDRCPVCEGRGTL
jgi:hypothetical protein